MKLARLTILLAAVVLIFALGLQITLSSPQEQTAAEIGIPSVGQTAYEFIAQIDQSGFDLTISGYLTHVGGIAADSLFVAGTNPAERSEASAYLTMQATGSIYARSVLQSIFDTNASLTLTIYYHETPGASFDDLASFAAGTPVAVYTVRLQNILNVQSPDVGIANSNGESVQSESTPFSLNGQDVRFGRVGMTTHLSAFGQGFRQSVEPLAVRLLTAGNAVVTNWGE
ncbi:MAG: hypothetical protein U0694_26040 [Anaerolineae bacterium]